MSDLNNTTPAAVPDRPIDLEAERNLLGALMQDGSLLGVISEKMGALKVEEFASERNQIIYYTILHRSSESDDFNPTILCDMLENSGDLDQAGGRAYIGGLVNTNNYPSSAILEFAQIIRHKAQRRAMLNINDQIMDMCFNPNGRSVKEIYNEAEGLIFKLVEGTQKNEVGPQPVVPKAVEILVDIQKNMMGEESSGILTGFAQLDEITQGLQPGSLNIIAARPSVGKTSFAMNIVANIAMNPNIHKPALVFSLEMPTEQLLLRLLSTFGHVSMNNLKSGQVQAQQWSEMVRRVKLLAESTEDKSRHDKLYIDDSGDITPLELRSRARKLYMENGGLSVIMIDYIQLMRSQNKQANRTLEIGEISRSLKLLAKELSVPIIALAQLNREVDNRKDHRPLNSDLRESGSLEQDADMIMFLHRDAVYGKAANGEDNSNQALLIIGKNRNGATADIDLIFQGEYTAFYDKGYAETLQMEQSINNNAIPASL